MIHLFAVTLVIAIVVAITSTIVVATTIILFLFLVLVAVGAIIRTRDFVGHAHKIAMLASKPDNLVSLDTVVL